MNDRARNASACGSRMRELPPVRAALSLLLAAALLPASFGAAGCASQPSSDVQAVESADGVVLETIPDYDGEAAVELNGNEVLFDEDDFGDAGYEEYAELDELGRCGTCLALVGEETMPDEERGDIGEVRPTGWQTSEYDWIDGGYLYNRCHLIGYRLTSENANEQNLITGTRYMNVEGMEPYESLVADYVRETGGHVMYRVTPVFVGDELVARGVVMEAKSLEDDGLEFCVYCFNVQPGVDIDYATGDNSPDGTAEDASQAAETSSDGEDAASSESSADGNLSEENLTDDLDEATYILNANTMKFHEPDCDSVDDMAESNKIGFTGTREEAIEAGYSPCKRCEP